MRAWWTTPSASSVVSGILAREVSLSSWGLLHEAGLVGETRALREPLASVNDLSRQLPGR